jgi:DNA ligase 4
MRFPRAVGIREDLTVVDCMTATEVLDTVKTVKKRKMDTTEIG